MIYIKKNDKKIKNHICDICEMDLAKNKRGCLRCQICDYDKCSNCI